MGREGLARREGDTWVEGFEGEVEVWRGEEACWFGGRGRERGNWESGCLLLG